MNTSILNLRVADIWACYKQRGDKGAFFLSEPLDDRLLKTAQPSKMDGNLCGKLALLV